MYHIKLLPKSTKEPFQMSVLCDSPFDEVSVDLDGETLLLMIYDYSRFLFVEPVSSTAASAVIPKLDQLFATFGTPCVVKVRQWSTIQWRRICYVGSCAWL